MTADAQTTPPIAQRSALFLAALLALVCGLSGVDRGWPQMPDNRDVKLDPEDEVSPAYRETIDERDRQRLERAREEGESFMTTVQGAGRAPGDFPPPVLQQPGAGASDIVPLQQVPAASERPSAVYETEFGRDAPGEDVDNGLAAMVGVLLEAWTRPPEIARLRYASQEAQSAEDAVESAADGDGADRLPPIQAGTGFYARTLYGVDSNYPGPVVLELLQPPLAGAVVHGGFERVRQRLVLRFTSLTWRGRTWPIDAWGVDPQCACYGIEGEVDRHFLSRVVLPAAARFAEGFLDAVAMPARTITMHDGTVLEERGESGTEEALYAGAAAATRTLGDILIADAPKETTVRIPRGTPLVVMVARLVAAAPGEVR